MVKNEYFYIVERSNIPDNYTMLFDGVNEKVDISTNAIYSKEYNQPFSFGIWFKTTNNALSQTIVTKRGAAGTQYYGVFFVSGQLALIFRGSSGDTLQIITTGASLMSNTWYHFGIIYDGDNTGAGTSLYVNGVLKSKSITGSVASTVINAQPLSIGGSAAALAYMNGHLGHIKMWNTDVLESTIITDYNDGEMNNDSDETANLILDWRSGQGALYNGTNWYFPEESGNIVNPSPGSVNMEFTDRTIDLP